MQNDDVALAILGQRQTMFGTPAVQQALSLNTGLNPLIDMLGSSILDKFFASQGMQPFELFPTQNTFDFWQKRAQFQAMQLAIQSGAQSDQESAYRILRGAAHKFGIEVTPDVEKSLRTGSTWFEQTLGPLGAQLAPDVWDRLHGSRGSAAVLSRFAFEGGQVAVDSVTGEVRQSADTIHAIEEEISDRYFRPGGAHAFRNLRRGEVGQIYAGLAERGMLGQSMSAFDEESQLDILARDRDSVQRAITTLRTRHPEAAGDLGTDEDILSSAEKSRDVFRKLKDAAPDEFNQSLRQFDAKKYADRIEQLAGAVQATKDIFASIGKLHASGEEILTAADQLTQGGLMRLTPEKLEESLRMTESLGKLSGLGISGMMTMQAHAAARADALGIERSFAVNAAQHAAGFSVAFGATGAGGVNSWRSISREKSAAIDLQLTTQAAESAQANQMNTALRIADETKEAGGKSSELLNAYTEALRKGDETFVDPHTGQRRSTIMNANEFRQFMGEAGVSERRTNATLRQTAANREYGDRYNTTDLVRGAGQRQTFEKIAISAQQGHAANMLREAGIPDPGGTLALEMSAAAVHAIQSLSEQDRKSPEKVKRAAADAMRKVLDARGHKGKISDADLFATAGLGYGELDQQIKQNMPGLENAEVAYHETSKQMETRRKEAAAQAKREAEGRSSLAGTNKDLLVRGADALADEARTDSMADKAMAGTDKFFDVGGGGRRGDVSKVEKKPRDVARDAHDAQVAKGDKEKPADPAARQQQPLKIAGTLKIEGLDKATLVGTADAGHGSIPVARGLA